jgi:DNA-binding transcriptional ArsR family regulator
MACTRAFGGATESSRSLWTRPGFTVRWTQPTLVYPLGRFAWMAPTATKSHGDPLAAVLGTTRARVLRALADEHTTSGLARVLGISLASASTHAAVLRDAGLVTSRRQGQSVRHTLTSLGAQWTSNDQSNATKAV